MSAILFYSTNLQAAHLTFREALLKGIAPDRGLYMPEEIPRLTADEIASFTDMTYHQVAFEICHRFLRDQIDKDTLYELVKDAYNYEVPLEQVYDKKYIMRLDQGPTASFKDFAARMMGRLMQHYLIQQNRKLLILTATSGDTGSAIANAFYGLDNIEVLVLFPEKEVTARQRKQMTTLGRNVQIVAVDGKFDDCQALVKEAFADPDMDDLHLSSANSINIGRLIPQSVYYAYSFAHLRSGHHDDSIVFSIPSGNFGDMMGGLLAKSMGIPIDRFVIAVNENDEFTKYLSSGIYEKIAPSRNCISSAMNVGHPSNLSRVTAYYGGTMDEQGNIIKKPDFERMQKDMISYSITDTETEEMIKEAWQAHDLLLEPHGSVGWAGLMRYLKENPELDGKNKLFVSLETAHPAKFPEKIIELLEFDPALPASLEGLEEKTESYDFLDHDYSMFKQYLNKRYR
ncbi:threonine synthase [bacterium]|nr:threonine synthase [bacterium]